ncbi:tumor necrosis factor receptor superfamily member 14 [Notechis scutatus]|uniref:Tumor necrosis factor receptor superfamily member 14 n=1 Tax=Notechis scutatus TaxID=8663 RepID=A0A6J1VLT7_9SAUR|nr:tumor necrosis factor receptor superfamily member 14 [Notechis scutatus]
MSLVLHVALVIHLLLLPDAFSCESWEYSIKGECCPKCSEGQRVLRHCTRATNTVCVSCDPGWFTEHPNGLRMCLKCRECSPGNHMEVKERCHYTKDAKCTCQPGFFCAHQLEVDSCDVCRRHATSPPGFRVTQAGTEINNVKYEPCPLGTFSLKEMSPSCIEWTNCSEKGLIQTQEGSATSDVVCGPQPPTKLALILVPVSILLLIFTISLIVWKKKKCLMKAIGKNKAEEEPYYPGPEKECMVKPIQETNPNIGQPSYAN